MNNIDDSGGGLAPALVLPIGQLKTGIMDFIQSAGIDVAELDTISNPDTIYFTFGDTMSFKANFTGDDLSGLTELALILGRTPTLEDLFDEDGVAHYVPDGINFSIPSEESSHRLDFFQTLEAQGGKLYFDNPQFSFTIDNYIGADITVKINEIKASNSIKDTVQKAIFDDEEGATTTSFSFVVEKAPEPRKYKSAKKVFDKHIGKTDKLFAIAPNEISYDFGIDFKTGEGSFLVKDTCVDVEYEVKVPFTLGPGTKFSKSDTMQLDLSGNGFIGNINNFILWIDYENSLQTTLDLDFKFLNENNELIDGLEKKHFEMKGATSMSTVSSSNRPAEKDVLKLEFKGDEVEKAKATRSILLQFTLKTPETGTANINPKDYINLKLSAYTKVNI
jgi:hypothetical protein